MHPKDPDGFREGGGECQRHTSQPMHPEHPDVLKVGVPVSYTHLRAHETGRNLVCRLLLEKKK